MFNFLLPKHVKQGRQFAHDARKLIAYKRDLWSPEVRAEFEETVAVLEKANATREEGQIEAAARALDQLCGRRLPKIENAGLRENVEVFLVAIVIALGVRTFFLQPFTIPTGSMQPTLNGVLGFPTQEEPPGLLVRLAQTAWFGRTWINTVAKDDESVADVSEVPQGGWRRFFTYSEVRTSAGNTYLINAPARTLTEYFGVNSLRNYKRGEPIARGYINTGDHVFVDKISYHFRAPRRGDVFVFNTQDIPKMGNQGPPPRKPSQFYIKRLVGLPLDELRVKPPELFINGHLAEGPGFQRVMSDRDGYRGYSNVAEYKFPSGQIAQSPMTFLNSPDDTFTVPERHFWAMGDNSYHSSDSRDWGPVPQQNLMGRGFFVYWPFAPHWGLIK